MKMTMIQRRARATLVVAGLTLGAYLVLVPAVGWWPATGAAGLLGLWGAMEWVFPLRGKDRPGLDEREQMILRRSHGIGYTVVWLLITTFVVLIALLAEDAVPKLWIVSFFWMLYLLFGSSQAIATLIQCRFDHGSPEE